MKTQAVFTLRPAMPEAVRRVTGMWFLGVLFMSSSLDGLATQSEPLIPTKTATPAATADTTATTPTSGAEPAPVRWPQPQQPAGFRLELEPTKAPCWACTSIAQYIDKNHAWLGLTMTEDGGLTWRRVRLSAEALAAWGLDLEQWHDPDYQEMSYLSPLCEGTHFVSAQRGWLGPATRDGTGLWNTSDGGLSWQRVAPWGFRRLFFVNSMNGWCQLPVPSPDDKDLTQTFTTSDGGESWQPCGEPFQTRRSDQLQRVYFASRNVGWAVVRPHGGGRYLSGVARTLDAGCRWERVWLTSLNLETADIYFLNESQGWLSGAKDSKSFYRTRDGGHSWEEGPTPSEDGALSIYFISEERGWVSDRCDQVFETNDGGKSWRALSREEVLSGFPPLPDGRVWNHGEILRMLMRGGCKLPR